LDFIWFAGYVPALVHWMDMLRFDPNQSKIIGSEFHSISSSLLQMVGCYMIRDGAGNGSSIPRGPY
jgi:hypothetical protein